MLARKIVVAIGLAILLPMTVHFGVDLIAPEPTAYNSYEYDQKIENAKSPAVKQKLEADKKQAETKYNAEEQHAERTLFYVGYPVGLAAFLIGGFFRMGASGIGLMYGGLATLASSTYYYWDKMGKTMRFEALVVAFVIVLVYGVIKLRSEPRRAGPAPAT